MSLRLKMLLILLGVFVLYDLLVVGAQRYYLAPRFQEVEKSQAVLQVKRSFNMAGMQVENLLEICQVLSRFPRLRQVLEGQASPDDLHIFSEAGLSTDVYHLAALIDREGRVRHCRAFHPSWDRALTPPLFADGTLSLSHPLVRLYGKDAFFFGIFPSGQDMPMLLVSVRIDSPGGERSEGLGSLVLGRFVDEFLLQELEKLQDTQLSMWPLTMVPQRLKPIVEELETGKPFVVREGRANYLEVYSFLQDYRGKGLALLRGTVYRGFSVERQMANHFNFWVLILAGFISLLAVFVLMEKLVLARVFQVNRLIHQVTHTGDLSVRMKEAPEDEMGALIEAFNAMMAALEKSKADLQENKRQLELALMGGNLGLWDWDVTSRKLSVNTRCATMLGYSPAEFPETDKEWRKYIHPEDQGLTDAAMQDHLEAKTPCYEVQYRARAKDGSWKWIQSRGVVVERSGQGEPLRAVGTRLDITDTKKTEEELRLLATTDHLTGLLNRRQFIEMLEKEMVRSRRYHHPLATIMLDLDHFKSVNDRFGHAAGDAVLVHFARLCQSELRDNDLCARLGGEEFAILLISCDASLARLFAERIREKVDQTPVPYGEHQIYYTVSLGVAELSANEETASQLMVLADRALYEAKEKGRNRVEVAKPASS